MSTIWLSDRRGRSIDVVTPERNLGNTMTESLESLVDTFYRAFAGQPDLLDDVVTPDWADIPLAPGQAPGPDGAKPIINRIAASVSDFSIVVHDIVDGRDHDGTGMIGVRAEMRGIHSGELFGIPPTGASFKVPVHEFHHVAGGRLARTYHLEDWFGFFNQIGAVPAVAEEAR